LEPVNVPAQSLALDTTAHTVTATFPSLRKLNITCLAPVDDPPKPPPSKASQTAKGKKPADQDTKQPDCPSRLSDAGSLDRPNGIVLQLVECDQTKQLCPSVTNTSITREEQFEWLQHEETRAATMQGLLLSNSAVKNVAARNARKAALDGVEQQIRAAETALHDDLSHPPGARKTTLPSFDESLYGLRLAMTGSILSETFPVHATIGVSLSASQASTNPAESQPVEFRPSHCLRLLR